jgi:hypothetical protein
VCSDSGAKCGPTASPERSAVLREVHDAKYGDPTMQADKETSRCVAMQVAGRCRWAHVRVCVYGHASGYVSGRAGRQPCQVRCRQAGRQETMQTGSWSLEACQTCLPSDEGVGRIEDRKHGW